MEMSAFPDIKTHGNGRIGKKGCQQKKGVSGKLANKDVSAKHVADMSPTFPTKPAGAANSCLQPSSPPSPISLCSLLLNSACPTFYLQMLIDALQVTKVPSGPAHNRIFVVVYTCCAWAGGTFFSSCAVLSFFGSGGKQVLVYILMYLKYHTVVVLCHFFWFWWGIVFGTYVLHTVVVLCQFFWFWQ